MLIAIFYEKLFTKYCPKTRKTAKSIYKSISTSPISKCLITTITKSMERGDKNPRFFVMEKDQLEKVKQDVVKEVKRDAAKEIKENEGKQAMGYEKNKREHWGPWVPWQSTLMMYWPSSLLALLVTMMLLVVFLQNRAHWMTEVSFSL